MQAALLVVFTLIATNLMAGVEAEGFEKLEWYMHDNVGGSNPSTVFVAGPNGDVTKFYPFGTVTVVDDALTEGPSPDSKPIGRAQGCYVADSMSETSLLIIMTANLPAGKISLHGQDPVFDEVRELAVVGGTKAYRLVTGYAEMRTHFFDPVSGSAILKFDVYLKHSS